LKTFYFLFLFIIILILPADVQRLSQSSRTLGGSHAVSTIKTIIIHDNKYKPRLSNTV